jgi:hypothetical protein
LRLFRAFSPWIEIEARLGDREPGASLFVGTVRRLNPKAPLLFQIELFSWRFGEHLCFWNNIPELALNQCQEARRAPGFITET